MPKEVVYYATDTSIIRMHPKNNLNATNIAILKLGFQNAIYETKLHPLQTKKVHCWAKMALSIIQ